jgi:exonuclease VII small subunit
MLGSNVLSTDKQFQEIEDAMSNLESTIKHLDAYSRSLESQVKKFEKMSATNRTKSSKKE